ncbi:hypothetical protein MJN54_30150, partial [Salmonella enterica subsp. enterica serovar Kentucky]|nr:hypothetical protein [Salmonella enterica subsp. enterica serovar Kentucky]
PTSLNFFAIRNVEHSILGIAFEPEQYQALNPFWIIIGSPILATQGVTGEPSSVEEGALTTAAEAVACICKACRPAMRCAVQTITT